MQDGDNWLNFGPSTFSGIDSSYSLPNNTALITLQVCKGVLKGTFTEKIEDGVQSSFYRFTSSLSLMGIYCFHELLQELKNGEILLRLAHLYEVVILFFFTNNLWLSLLKI